MNDYNRRLIEEFRAHGGKVGGMWEGTPLLLLTTAGARSGERRTTPMAYLPDGDRLIVWARGVEVYPSLAEHQAKTTRLIPVIALSRQAS